MQVDIHLPKLKRWLPGKITRVDQNKISVKIDGYSDNFDKSLIWYDPNSVDYCGERIKDRDCDYQSRKPDSESAGLKIKVCFTPKGSCPMVFYF